MTVMTYNQVNTSVYNIFADWVSKKQWLDQLLK